MLPRHLYARGLSYTKNDEDGASCRGSNAIGRWREGRIPILSSKRAKGRGSRSEPVLRDTDVERHGIGIHAGGLHENVGLSSKREIGGGDCHYKLVRTNEPGLLR